jgi:hypothetical protein
MKNKKFLPYLIFGVPAVIGLYFVYKAIKNSKTKGQDAPPNYDPNNNSNVDPKPNGGVTPSVAKTFPLRKGSKGGKVIELQRAMLGYDDSILGKYRDDGDFGTTTETALQTILGKKTADSQDDIDAITKKANDKKKNQATQIQVDNTNNNRLNLANKLIAEYRKDPSSKDFSAIVDTAVYTAKKTSDGRLKDGKTVVYRKNEKIPLSSNAVVTTGTTTGGLVGFIVANDPYNDNYYSFSPYAFEVK